MNQDGRGELLQYKSAAAASAAVAAAGARTATAVEGQSPYTMGGWVYSCFCWWHEHRDALIPACCCGARCWLVPQGFWRRCFANHRPRTHTHAHTRMLHSAQRTLATRRGSSAHLARGLLNTPFESPPACPSRKWIGVNQGGPTLRSLVGHTFSTHTLSQRGIKKFSYTSFMSFLYLMLHAAEPPSFSRNTHPCICPRFIQTARARP